MSRFPLVAVGVALVLALALRAPEARASTPPPVNRVDGWTELFKYAGCAAAIAVAVSTTQVYVAVFGCAALISEELGY